jgi:SAM-dependent methyltransferase
MFSRADAYERYMGRWSHLVAPALIELSEIRDGDAVLDIGSGTGVLSFAVRDGTGAGQITGVDASPDYVAYATHQNTDPRVRFEVGDAQRLPFPDAAFDRAVSLCVLNFVPDPTRAVQEMMRVTRPGGSVAVAVWDYAGGMEMLRVFWDEAVAVTPANAAKDERHMPLCRQGDLGALWRERGLRDVVEEGLTIETRFASFDDFWSPFLEKQGPAGVYVASMAPADRETLRMRLRRRLLGEGPDKAIVLQARAWAVRGTVP